MATGAEALGRELLTVIVGHDENVRQSVTQQASILPQDCI
jgi:hypothetical protein